MTTLDRARSRLMRLGRTHLKHFRQRAGSRMLGAHQRQAFFVTGVQRSGTNMVMDLFEADMGTEVFHETDSRAFDNYELRSFDVLSRLVDETAAPITIFKALCECQMVSELLDRFVGSRSIWVYRHYEKVAASHVKKWTQMPDTIRRLVEDDGDTHGWRGRGMSTDTLAVLRACYHDDLNNESACALFWYLRNQLYFDQALDRDPRVALLNYEQLLADPHDYTAALFEFAGLSYKSGAGAIIKPQGVGNSTDVLPIEPSVRKLCDAMVERLHAARHLRVDSLAGRC